MDQIEHTPRKPGSSAPRLSHGRGRKDAAFDLWLQRGLHQMFDDVAREPIPEDLLKLIRDDEQK
jgi:hypothetical protein